MNTLINNPAEELDSYLYQTVGQDAIEFVAQALEVPLYRRVIHGDAVSQGLEYGGRKAKDSGGVHGDETEDLFEVLALVKVSFNGVHARLSQPISVTPPRRSRGLCRCYSVELPAHTR